MNLNQSFSFTFTIPPFKKVYWDKKKRPYANLSFSQQYHLLEGLMFKIINPLKYLYIDWVYEQHKEDKRLHMHGFCITTDENSDQIYLLRDAFYSVNQIIGIKMSNYLKISDIQKTYSDLNYWLEYINKHQDTIIFKNGYRQQNDLTESLDHGVCKHSFNNDYIKLPNWCDEPETEYKFKGKNKFIIEI